YAGLIAQIHPLQCMWDDWCGSAAPTLCGRPFAASICEVSSMSRTPPGSGVHEPPSPDPNRREPYLSGREPGPRRRSLLRDDPGIDVVDMATLVQVARAIEDEAVRRYELLADLMHRRGEAAVASAFRVMLEEERRHVAAVD